MRTPPIVFIISGPSGSGKSTLVRRLLESVPRLLFSVSYTTRARRGQEEPGKSYHYVSREQFQALVAEEQFLEWAEVFGHYYGTHRRYLEMAAREGKDLVLDIDVQGARQLKSKVPDAVSVFVLAPSRQELEHRLRHRSEDAPDAIARRVAAAAQEIAQYSAYDYLLVNSDLDEAAENLAAIVKAERLRSNRMQEAAQAILAGFGAGAGYQDARYLQEDDKLDGS